MLYNDRINMSEGINLAKSNKRKECMICHYWFLKHRFAQSYISVYSRQFFYFTVFLCIKWLIVWSSISL